jgi:polar amino acid transport system substrate-binding protein
MLTLCLLNGYAMAKKSEHNSGELTLATTRWCPYTCFDEHKEFGIVGIYIKKILSAHNIHLSIVSYPWSRALRLVKTKEVNGLLTATPAEAPELLFSDSPIGSYQMCFYTLNTSNLQFDKSIDFGNNLLAVVQDYGYGEPLDSYIKKNKSVTSISGSNVTDRLISLLIKGRVDVIVTDKLVVDYKIANHSIDASTLKQAGCLVENDFYLALRPSADNKKLLEKIDKALIEPENINYFKDLKLTISNK